MVWKTREEEVQVLEEDAESSGDAGHHKVILFPVTVIILFPVKIINF